jgi:NADH:ubiquinone oxidoreductase subunit 5 (subunit L)/multisubunit Na+/H+ antiporter MnhA subunit
MLLLIILFPLLGFLVSILFGRFLGAKGVSYLTVGFVGLSLILSIWSFFTVALTQKVFVYNLFSWFSSSLIFSNLGIYV